MRCLGTWINHCFRVCKYPFSTLNLNEIVFKFDITDNSFLFHVQIQIDIYLYITYILQKYLCHSWFSHREWVLISFKYAVHRYYFRYHNKYTVLNELCFQNKTSKTIFETIPNACTVEFLLEVGFFLIGILWIKYMSSFEIIPIFGLNESRRIYTTTSLGNQRIAQIWLWENRTCVRRLICAEGCVSSLKMQSNPINSTKLRNGIYWCDIVIPSVVWKQNPVLSENRILSALLLVFHVDDQLENMPYTRFSIQKLDALFNCQFRRNSFTIVTKRGYPHTTLTLLSYFDIL